MIDISQISCEHISRLAAAYLHASFIFGVDPAEASVQKQRKIRKWISRQYIELVYDLPDEARIFSVENSDREVLLFLKKCVEFHENKFEKDFERVDEAVKTAFKKLLQLDTWPEMRCAGRDIQIVVEDTPAYREILTLKNADDVPNGKKEWYCQNLEMTFQKEKNRFCFCGELEDFAAETVEHFALTFEDAEVEVQVYNPCNEVFVFENPWDFLRTICSAIVSKAELPGECYNEKEKELLPIMKEIAALREWHGFYGKEFLAFDELKRLVRKYDVRKAERLLGKLETIKSGTAAFRITVEKLTTILCEKQYEPLWRELYNRIVESQTEYPNKVDFLCDGEQLARARNEIQKLMAAKGYMGTYPDFVKEGALQGIHLEHSYNMSYIVCMEKNVRYHVHCDETWGEDEALRIRFLCGTAFLKKEEETDIYDCLFNAKGRRLFHTVLRCLSTPGAEESESDALETAITIATKKAECAKLSKAEQEELGGGMISGWNTFWWIFLVGGGVFGIVMTLIMMISCMLMTVTFGLFADIPEMLKTIPWGLLLGICWAGFGGTMGIVEVFARRK